MVRNESSMGRAAGAFGRFLVGLAALAVLGVIAFSFWPKAKAAYYAIPAQAQTPAAQPADDSTARELAQLKARLAAAEQRFVVQGVPEGQPQQNVTIPSTPPAPPLNTTDGGDSSAGSAEPPAAPLLIVIHDNATHGAPIVTGSGACAVAAKGARRCGK